MNTFSETLTPVHESSIDQVEDGQEVIQPAILTIIEPRSGWRLVDWRELIDYRDLFLFLTWRHIKVQYAQSTLGIGWAIIQPLFSMVVFTIVFGQTGRGVLRRGPLCRV